MTCSIRESNENGLAVYDIANDRVKAVVSPTEGGKIRHLVNLDTGRDYCWQMPDPPANERRIGLSYPDADCTGIDDCVPTIAACTWKRTDRRGTRRPSPIGRRRCRETRSST